MAASTVYSSKANSKSFEKLCRKTTAVQKNPNLRPVGLYAFDSGSDTVASTSVDEANDEHFTLKFPDNTYLVSLQVTFSDIDTHATPTSVVNVIVEDSSGTETTLIASSTAGQAGGSDELDANGGHILRDVSNQYLGFKVGTGSATAAAGTVRFKGIVWRGDLVTNF